MMHHMHVCFNDWRTHVQANRHHMIKTKQKSYLTQESLYKKVSSSFPSHRNNIPLLHASHHGVHGYIHQNV